MNNTRAPLGAVCFLFQSILSSLLVILPYATTALGTRNVWTPIGPDGGTVMSLTIDPENPLTIYAGTSSSGMFATRDRGDHWTQFGAFPGRQVCGLVVDPVNPDAFYAIVGCAGGGGAFRTTDAGVHWNRLDVGAVGTGPLQTLVVDPTNPTTLYAVVNPGGVFKSTDSGENWIPTGSGVVYPYTRALAIDPADPATVYVGAFRGGIGVSFPNSGGLYKTTDGGDSWQEMNVGLPERFGVLEITVDPSTRGTVYIGTTVGLFKSTDGAVTWEDADPGRAEMNVSAIAIDPSAPQTIYAVSSTACYACSSTVSKSIDGGCGGCRSRLRRLPIRSRRSQSRPTAPCTQGPCTEVYSRAAMEALRGALRGVV